MATIIQMRTNAFALLFLIGLNGATFAGTNEWTQAGEKLNSKVNAVQFDPDRPNRFLAGAEDGFYRSDDGGQSWQIRGPELVDRSVMSLAVDRGDTERIYAGLNNGLFYSADGGNSWTKGEGLNAGVFAIVSAQETDGRVYAGTFGRGVFVSADFGSTWREGGEELDGEIIFSLATTRLEPQTVYAGTARGLFVSGDAGESWTALGEALQGKSVRSIHLPSSSDDGGLILVGTFGDGVWRSLDRGVSWTGLNDGLEDLAVRGLAVDEEFNQLIYAATSTGGFFRTTDGGVRWRAINKSLPSLAARRVAVLSGETKSIIGVGAAPGVWEISFAPEAQIAVEREPIDFGRGSVESQLSFELEIGNAGKAELHLSRLSIEGNSSFLVNPTRLTVPPGETRSATIGFVPRSRGEKRATLIINSNDPDELRTEIDLHGTGVQGQLTANLGKIDFGEVRLEGFKDTTVVLTNAGNANLSLNNAYFEDGVFRVLSFQPQILRPGQRVILSVRFLPLLARGVSSKLVLVSSQPSLEIAVDGVGTAPEITVTSRTIDFGTVDLYRTETLELEISNSGNTELNVDRVELEGEQFRVDLITPLVIAPGQIETAELTFLPLVSGGHKNLLRIISDAPGPQGTLEIELVGIGGGLALSAQTPVEIGEGAVDLLVADWNQDGAPDLAIADSSAGEVRVLLNDGSGIFFDAAVYPGSSSLYEEWDAPVALAAAPIFAGFPDLIVADQVARSISILENAGDGTFDHYRRDIFIGHRIADVLAVDLDTDGDVDIAVANGDIASITLLFNNGEGSFNARVSHPVEQGPVALAAANLNADGQMDIVVANSQSGTISVLFGKNRSGDFEAYRSFVVGLEPVAVELVDFDADGDNDVLVANRGSRDIIVLENELDEGGGLDFNLNQQMHLSMPLVDLALSDLTADVFSDLIAVSPEGTFVTFLENEAGKAFTVRDDSLEASGSALKVEIVDMNGDGANDVVVLGSSQVQLFINRDVRRLDPPRAPTAVEARDRERDLGRQIDLLWQAPDLDEQIGRTTEYVIFRAEKEDGPFAAIDTVEAGMRSYTDRAATLADTFYYYVRAGHAALYSPPSSTVWAVSRPAPFFELELVEGPRVSIGDTLRVRAYITPAQHRIAGVSLFLTFADDALELVSSDTLNPIPFKLVEGLKESEVENRLHPRTTNKINLSLARQQKDASVEPVLLGIEASVEPVLLGEVWFVTKKDTVTFISIDDEEELNRQSSVVESSVIEDRNGTWIFPPPAQKTRVDVRDYQVSGRVLLRGREETNLGVQVSLLFVDEGGDTLKSPLNDEDRLRPGIQYQLDEDGSFRLVQIPKGNYQVLAKAPTHLQGRVLDNTVAIGDSLRTHLVFRWEGADSTLVSDSLPDDDSLPAGDGNDDNRINLADFGIWVRYSGKSSANPQVWSQAKAVDFNGDGEINSDDFWLLADHFGEVGMGVKGEAEKRVMPQGWVRSDPAGIQVGELGKISGFSLLVAGVDEVEFDLEETVWAGWSVRVLQWREENGVRIAGALSKAGGAVAGDGQLIRLGTGANGRIPSVVEAEILDADGRVQLPLFSQTRALPSISALLQNYPNPFNPTTIIPFVVGASSDRGEHVRLEIYNSLGQKVRILVDKDLPAGLRRIVWDGRDQRARQVASGLYLYRLQIGYFQETRRLLLVR